ncbi:MAG: acyl carrier protein [Firmicutes bacterium CAG:272_52_7]|nr:MAG: acyl carrier protein [Firmicutes bacterium CAG:272_52_7]
MDFETCDTLVDDGILDSMDIVSLVTDIFNEFDVRIPADRIVPENFNSAAALWELVSELIDE